MDVQEADDPANGTRSNESLNVGKQAACLECRRSKIKCVRAPGASVCRKCQNANTSCVIPDYHVGRYKGVKNKRTGLEKAIHQVEEAIKKAKTSSSALEDEQAQALQKLLGEGNASISPPSKHGSSTAPEDANTVQQPRTSPRPNRRPSAPMDRRVSFAQEPANSDEVTVNNADNPLQLLAMASTIPEQNVSVGTPSTTGKLSHSEGGTGLTGEDEAQTFFDPICSRLDVSPELDPVELGLVSTTEAKKLFEYFHTNLAHTRWGLDTTIHSAEFVRSRSAYLYTSVIAAAALFLPDTAALSKRLLNHCKFLAQQIIFKRYRSVEIVLAFMVNIPWMIPGQNWASDDETCYYLSMALTIALDLSLNKMVFPSPTRPPGVIDRIARSDCIDPRKALDLDEWSNIETSSPTAQRLLRTRERTWLALFNLDRGVCLARGRPMTVPSGPLIETCDTWHNSDLAANQDGSLVASTVLRRDFAPLVSTIRNTCDSNELNISNGSLIVKFMKEKIEGFFNDWHTLWDFQIHEPDGSLPPYVGILVSHGKLSAYCSVINHPTAPPDVKQFFQAAGLASALDVMRVAIQSEFRMKSMPNNTVIMVSFAACFVLGLSTTKQGDQVYLAPNVKKSIEETAEVLERIGSHPEHRKGASALFGKHIKRIMKAHIASSEHNAAQGLQNSANASSASQIFVPNLTQPYTMHSSLGQAQSDFPAYDMMTDDQLLAAIQNAKDDIDSFNAGFQTDDSLVMDWLEWPSTTW